MTVACQCVAISPCAARKHDTIFSVSLRRCVLNSEFKTMIDYSKHSTGEAFEAFAKDIAKINVSPSCSPLLSCTLQLNDGHRWCK